LPLHKPGKIKPISRAYQVLSFTSNFGQTRQAAAQQARQQLFPQEVIACFLKELAHLRPLLAELGWSIEISPIPVSA
jgi:hypothetical protein